MTKSALPKHTRGKSLSFSEEKRLEHIKELIKREYKHQCELAEALNIEPQNLSRCLRSGKISDKMCSKIKELFPKYRLEWLLGYDDYMTEEELINAHDRGLRLNAPITVLDTALHEVCAREGIDVPTLDNIPELMILENQLRDYANSLMYNYVMNREGSHFWSGLDQALETIEKKLKK